jgi:hypothetical protein
MYYMAYSKKFIQKLWKEAEDKNAEYISLNKTDGTIMSAKEIKERLFC